MNEQALAGKTVLLVEDNPLISGDLEVQLRDAAASVLAVATVADALRCAEDLAISLAVLDVSLRDGTSGRVCERLNKLGVPFVFYSAHNSCSLFDRWPNIKVISKPASAEKMIMS